MVQPNRAMVVPYSLWVTSAVTVTLERSRASDAELERLARALAESDNDDVLRQAFLMMRAGIIREDSISNRWVIGSRAAPAFVVDKPWQTRQFNRQLAWYAEVLDAVDMPWPARIDAIDRVDVLQPGWSIHPGANEEVCRECRVAPGDGSKLSNRSRGRTVPARSRRAAAGEPLRHGSVIPAFRTSGSVYRTTDTIQRVD